MTTPTLEVVEFPSALRDAVEDFTIGCECFLGMPCDNAATWVVRFWCDCIRLNCMSCVTKYLVYLGDRIGRMGFCSRCGAKSRMFKISDVVKSIDPL